MAITVTATTGWLEGEILVTLTNDSLCLIISCLHAEVRREKRLVENGEKIGMRLGRIEALLKKLPPVI